MVNYVLRVTGDGELEGASVAGPSGYWRAWGAVACIAAISVLSMALQSGKDPCRSRSCRQM